MKFILFFLLSNVLFLSTVSAQNLQLHYDFRHSIAPKLHAKNFPGFSFEYFKNIDTIQTGSFLFKLQADLRADKGNMNQAFVQLSQTLKFWSPKVYLSFNYSGGLGFAPPIYGYTISNAFGLGLAYPFQWREGFFNLNAQYRYNAFPKPSHDAQVTFYFGRGFFNYKIFVSGSLVGWTENRNQGNEFTKGLSGKKFAFFGDPQIWYNLRKGFSMGSRINVFYHVLTPDHSVQLYPTLGTKFQF